MVSKYVDNQSMPFNIYDVFYSQCSHQHVSGDVIITRIQNVKI